MPVEDLGTDRDLGSGRDLGFIHSDHDLEEIAEALFPVIVHFEPVPEDEQDKDKDKGRAEKDKDVAKDVSKQADKRDITSDHDLDEIAFHIFPVQDHIEAVPLAKEQDKGAEEQGKGVEEQGKGAEEQQKGWRSRTGDRRTEQED